VSAVAFGLFVASLYCFYKQIELGVTAEEGLRYSIPAMQGSGTYTAAQLTKAESVFRQMDFAGKRWGTCAEMIVAASIGTAITAGWRLRSVRKQS
jgi:hypothetical protein